MIKYLDITSEWLFEDTINYIIFKRNNIEGLIFLLTVTQLNKKIKEEFISGKYKHFISTEMEKILQKI